MRANRFVFYTLPFAFVLTGAIQAFAQPSVFTELTLDLGEDNANRLIHIQGAEILDGDTRIEMIGYRLVRRNLDPAEDNCFYFNADDAWINSGSRPRIDITIQYYDLGTGTLSLQYDSYDPATSLHNSYKSAGSIDLGNTQQRKTKTFQITDAYFGNWQDGGADFRLVGSPDEYFYIDTVKVTLYKTTPKYPPGYLGATHAAGDYFFDPSHDFLNEGAIEVTRNGIRSIKLWFMSDNPIPYYKWNSPTWPVSFATPKAMAEHPYYQQVLRRPFDTYVLTIVEGPTFRHGFPDPYPAQLRQKFYDLARYLLETYDGTGKTFILGTWESDWLLRGTYDKFEQYDPDQTAIDGMIRWYTARQNGVNDARLDVPDSDVNVYAAAEVNLVDMAMQGRPTVTNDVLPYVNMDLITYSAWDNTNDAGTDEQGTRQELIDALDYIAAHAPDSTVPDPNGIPWGDKNIAITEFGAPAQRWGAPGPVKQHKIVRMTAEVAYEWGCPWIFYWNTYCNECDTIGDDPVSANEDCNGYWLKKVDGSTSAGHDYFVAQLRPYLTPPADFDAIRINDHTIQLTWADTEGEENYRLERRIDDGLWTLLAEPADDTTFFDDSSVIPGQTYWYRLRAENTYLEPTVWFYSQKTTNVPGDFNLDDYVDTNDLEVFDECRTAPGIPYDPQNLPFGCTLTPDDSDIIAADLNRDGIVDQSDFAIFQCCYSGAITKADPFCNP